MADQDWVSLFPQGDQTPFQGPGTTLNTATTATISPLPTGATADYNKQMNAADWRVGKLIEVTARGYLTTTTTSTTATFFLATNIDNTGTTYVTLATTAAITTGTTALTGLQWELAALIRCTALATSGNTISTQGRLNIINNATAPSLNAATNAVLLSAGLPAASGETAAAVNTMRTQGIALRGTLAGANATIVCTQWVLKLLN
jgi:hypothetical protein